MELVEVPQEENKFKWPQVSPRMQKSPPKNVVNPNDLFHNDLSVIGQNKAADESQISNTSQELNSEIKVSFFDSR